MSEISEEIKEKTPKPKKIKIHPIRQLLKENKVDIIYFQLIYIIISILLVHPMMILLYKGAINLAGYKIITSSNLLMFLIHPTTIIILLLMSFIWTLFFIYDFSTLAIIFDNQYHTYHFRQIVVLGFKKMSILFKKKNILILISLMIIIPVFSLSIYGNNFINLLSIIYSYIPKNQITYPIIVFVVVMVLFTVILYMFAPHLMFLNNKNAKESLKESAKIVKTNFYEIITKLFKTNLILILFVAALYILFELLFGSIIKGVASQKTGLTIFLSLMYGFNYILKYFSSVIFIIINLALFSYYFNKYNPEPIQIECEIQKRHKISTKVLQRLIIAISTIIVLVNSIVFFISISHGIINITGLYNILEVSAHRGSSLGAPENSLSAFELAIDEGTDAIELDVQLTKDNEVVVFHDERMNRVSSSSSKVSDLTLEEIKQIDIGSYFALKYNDERVPTLKEVFELVDGKAKINIEIKVYNSNSDYLLMFANKIYEVCEEYDAFYWIYFSSFNSTILANLKDMSNKYQVGLITSTGLSKYDKTKYDFISINEFVVDLNLVKMIHKAGLEIHVWTVDSDSRIIELINLGVDNIITNDPLKAKKIIYAKKSDFVIQQTFAWFFDQDEDLFNLLG